MLYRPMPQMATATAIADAEGENGDGGGDGDDDADEDAGDEDDDGEIDRIFLGVPYPKQNGSFLLNFRFLRLSFSLPPVNKPILNILFV